MFKDQSLQEIVIIDFGITKIVKSDKTTKINAFTYKYSAPEVINSEEFC